ncbi:hypothetical protein PO654_03335 [Phytobacter diazotrophicus]|jgi:hypothetical protein|uniref:Uncharacterized protein n=2 Tax=Enterobacteriaceae TaxID=543 RepID=A0ABW1Q2Z8_9ENTR|nr:MULTISPECIES: hypothetical protein [Phytobacter]MBS6739365.1 hypothetical protein [Enterobacteriaceae bacterium]PXW60671.1 hypothetical protein DFO55_10281 [Grimontella sp. AG753]MDU4152742.1 hypothetical protein [Enterobacteriaceae bacterium]MDU4353039.1 hypothetical protein [Phytobacter diazotrophicus]MDU7131352.1 hypothetical protein [Enterobacteriaceae bacterium]
MIYAYYIRDNDYFYYGSPYPDAREATQEEIAAHYAEIEEQVEVEKQNEVN